jgi:LysR family cys regulon transcriptional activator
MRLAQFSYVRAVIANEFNISKAAHALGTSQPRISKQIQALEHELGFEIFARKRNRVLGLTPNGEAIAGIARRISTESDQLRSIRDELISPHTGQLTVATTHSHARYTLLQVIQKFCKEYPDVTFTLRHSDPAEIAELVAMGTVDLGMSARPKELPPNVVCIPAYGIGRLLITSPNHPLQKLRKLTLAEIAKYPLVGYDQKFSSGWRVMEAFSRENLSPRVVLTAIDAEVVKAYVAAGLGVAILQAFTFDPERDKGIACRSADALFEPSEAMIMLRKNGYLRQYAYRFIQLIKPTIDRVTVRNAVET